MSTKCPGFPGNAVAIGIPKFRSQGSKRRFDVGLLRRRRRFFKLRFDFLDLFWL